MYKHCLMINFFFFFPKHKMIKLHLIFSPGALLSQLRWWWFFLPLVFCRLLSTRRCFCNCCLLGWSFLCSPIISAAWRGREVPAIEGPHSKETMENTIPQPPCTNFSLVVWITFGLQDPGGEFYDFLDIAWLCCLSTADSGGQLSYICAGRQWLCSCFWCTHWELCYETIVL